MSTDSIRTLHYVFRVSDRKLVMDFYRNVLGMRILRHEEFDEPCDAGCNGPFKGKWSKTMVGYGPEDNHFVVELTYNYDTHAYKLGDDYQFIRIHSKRAAANAEKAGGVRDGNTVRIAVPVDGYRYEIVDEDIEGDPVTALALRTSSLSRSLQFWEGVLGMQVVRKTESERAQVKFPSGKFYLEFLETAEKVIERGTAFGRVAFSCPAALLPEIQAHVEKDEASNGKVLTPLISLPTPGKATVQVVILADPDAYEICFVGDEAFRELSQVDPRGEELLDAAMATDTSMEWWVKEKEKEERQRKRKEAAAAAAAAASN